MSYNITHVGFAIILSPEEKFVAVIHLISMETYIFCTETLNIINVVCSLSSVSFSLISFLCEHFYTPSNSLLIFYNPGTNVSGPINPNWQTNPFDRYTSTILSAVLFCDRNTRILVSRVIWFIRVFRTSRNESRTNHNRGFGSITIYKIGLVFP